MMTFSFCHENRRGFLSSGHNIFAWSLATSRDTFVYKKAAQDIKLLKYYNIYNKGYIAPGSVAMNFKLKRLKRF